MMSKYIDADMVLPKLYEYHSQGAINAGVRSKNYSVPTFDPMEITDVLEAIPIADVAPVQHGKWIKLDMYAGMEQYKCSCCRTACYVPECMGEPLYHYCPECGAKMDGGEHSE